MKEEKKTIINDSGNEREIVDICSCGRPLIAALNSSGQRVGVTHTADDEDWHMNYWSTEKVIERKNLN